MADEPVIPVAEAQDEGPIPPVALLGINGTESHKALVSIMSRGKRYIIVIVFHRMPHAMEHRALSLIKKYFFKAIEDRKSVV